MPAPDPDPAPDAAQHASGIVELINLLGERSRDADSGAAISAAQLRLLSLIDRDEVMRMRSLCRRLGTTAPTVSRQCDRLQAMGLIERLPNPDSRREVTLRLTAAGRVHLRRAREQRDGILNRAIAALSPADQQALARGLTGLHRQLGAIAIAADAAAGAVPLPAAGLLQEGLPAERPPSVTG